MNLLRSVSLLALATAALSAQAGSLTTTFANDNRYGDGVSLLFDVDVLATNGLTVNSLVLNTGDREGRPYSVEVYVKSGSYVGSERNAAAWTLVSTGTGTTMGSGVESFVDVSDFSLAAGSYGWAVRYLGAIAVYTSGSFSGPDTYANADLSLAAGAVVTNTDGNFQGSLFREPNRIWNGTIDYTVNAAPSVPGPLAALPFALMALNRRRQRA